MKRAVKETPQAQKKLSEVEPNFASWLYTCCQAMPTSSQRGNGPLIQLHVATCNDCLSEWAYVLTLESFDRYTL